MDIIAATETSEISQIRLLVSSAFEEEDLSDEIITLDAFLGDSNRQVKELLPEWEDFFNLPDGNENKLRLKSIVRKVTGIKLLRPTARSNVSSLAGELVFDIDLLKAKELINQYKEEIEYSIDFLKKTTTETASGNSLSFGILIDP